MVSPTLGTVTYEQIAESIKNYIEQDLGAHYAICIGTDSQNFDLTKIVTVITVHKLGKGGRFFYEISKIDKLKDIRRKLYTETQMSLDCAEKLFDALDKLAIESDFDYHDYVSFSIHVDAGYNGPTKQLIPEIVGWIKSYGYDCEVKPNSPAASSVANKFSK